MDLTPTVLHSISTPLQLLHHILHTAGTPVTLIVCTSRASFLRQLLNLDEEQLHLQPTLQNLVLAQHVTIAYCTSVPSLHAYLTAHAVRSTDTTADSVESTKDASASNGAHGIRSKNAAPLLVILGMVMLHEPTPSFSAQGLGRAFAAAVSSGRTAKQKVVFAECLSPEIEEGNEDGDVNMGLDYNKPEEEVEQRATRARATMKEPWKGYIPILNATTKSFGPGERGWVGRTVEVRRIAERWCRFRTIDEVAGGEA